MLSPLSETGHLIAPRARQPRLEFTLAVLNLAAYAFATLSLLAALP
jgi:hypothetical protein